MQTHWQHYLAILALLSSLFLGGCQSFLLGKENLSEAVDLPTNPQAVGLTRRWQHSIGNGLAEKSLKLQPLVTASQIVAVSENGVLQAFSRDSGQPLWRTKAGHTIAAGISGNANVIVVASENGLLMAFSPEDGSLLWFYQLSTEVLAPPAVSRGLVMARTIDGQVTALSAKAGQLVWKQNIGTAQLSVRGNARSLIVNDLLLLTNARGHLIFLSIADGRVVLDTPISRGRGKTVVERVADLLATPTIRDGILFVSAYRQETLAIDLQAMQLRWKSPVATALDIFADNRLVYIVDKNSIIYALAQKTGQVIWQSNALEGRKISPLSGNGNSIVTVDNDGMLVSLSSRNGEVLGYTSVGKGRTYTAPRAVDQQWLTYTSNGKLTLTAMSGR